jgi:hypothetical protein
MSKCVRSFIPAALLGLAVTVSAIFSTDSAARAADDCLAEPSRAPAPGGHWYFHFDRASNRKCWYLVEPDTRSPTAEAAQAQPPAEPPPGFGSFFSLMGLSSAPIGSPFDTTGNVARPGDTARPDDPRNAAAPNPRPAVTRHPDTQAALTKPHRSPARPSGDHADEQSAAPPDQAERDALFQEFLRWRDRKTP